ncbi:MAG: hypothetical protein R3324_13935, partial [Halobacteriales archaeon]|nr:hypothetical protein [Halobacteriales archaeon]
MEAVSSFGSALKTTTCERSYPTLRGHPPTLELGEQQTIPSILESPSTGVTIEIPETYHAVFATATLAYYLGADLRPGEQPQIVTEDGFTYPLGQSGRALERGAERVLKQTFFLDCLTRTEGFFQVNLHERNQLEDALGLDFPSLYDRPLKSQLPAYLQVDYAEIEPYLPRWKLTAYATTEPAYIETLPFLVNDLAVIRSAESGIRQGRPNGAWTRTDDEVLAADLTRGATGSADAPELVRVRESDSIEQAWVGPGAPVGASKAMLEAFEHRLTRSPAAESIEITVVCNAAEMSQEGDLVNEIYGSREDLPFDLSVHHELETDALARLLAEDIDFLHYIGHIDEAGFECRDGHLDAASLEETNVDVFFLNACSSYEQGMNLIRAGSIAGVVTLEDVINSGAERIGLTLARFLNAGFPLWGALNLSKSESIMGGHYLV